MFSFVQSPRQLLSLSNIINGLSSTFRELENKLQTSSRPEFSGKFHNFTRETNHFIQQILI